jgi:hypothetical protein
MNLSSRNHLGVDTQLASIYHLILNSYACDESRGSLLMNLSANPRIFLAVNADLARLGHREDRRRVTRRTDVCEPGQLNAG